MFACVICFDIIGAMKTAILYCIFNRPDVVKETFEPIRKAKPPRLYIASDGARVDKEGEEEIVNRTRKYVLDNIDWDCQVFTLFQEKNIGCDTAIPTAVEWFFKHEEMGIILEDDILASQEFFQFCEILLEKYKDDPRVRNIGGTCLAKDVDYEYDYAFHQGPHTWGWAAWRRSWESFDIKISDWAKLRKTKWVEKIFNNHKYKTIEWREIFDEYYGDSAWDYAYDFANMKLIPDGCYSIAPANKQLVTNIGYFGYHFDYYNNSDLGWEIDYIDISNLKHPSEIKLDYDFLDKCYDSELNIAISKYEKLSFFKLCARNIVFPIHWSLVFIKYLLSDKNSESKKRRRIKLVKLRFRFIKDNYYYFYKKRNK